MHNTIILRPSTSFDGHLVIGAGNGPSQQNIFEDFLKNVKTEHQQAEQQSLADSRQKQGPAFILSADVCVFTDEHDLGNHQGVDQCKGVAQVLDVKFVQQEHAVGGQSAEENARNRNIPANSTNSWMAFRFRLAPAAFSLSIRLSTLVMHTPL